MSYSDEMKTEAKWAEIDLDALSYNMKNIREKHCIQVIEPTQKKWERTFRSAL